MVFIKPNSDEDIDGVIHYIRKRHINELPRFIHATCSSTFVETYKWGDALALINYDLSDTEPYNSWASDSVPKSNFTIYFYQNQLFITHYTVRSRTVNNKDMPRGWTVEGSNDNKTWSFVDEKSDINSLLTPKAIKTFEVDRPGTYRYFRFTQTQLNSLSRNFFSLSKVDFFGKMIYACNSRMKTQHTQFPLHISMLVLIIT